MVDETELFYASLAASWQLMTPSQLVAVLAEQADGGPSLTRALVDHDCATAEKVAQMQELAGQVFRNPLEDFSLDSLPAAGLIEVLTCPECGAKIEVEDFDPREQYTCSECLAPLPVRESPSLSEIDDTSRALPQIDAIDDPTLSSGIEALDLIDQTGEVVIATEDDDLYDDELEALKQKHLQEISLEQTGTYYPRGPKSPSEQIFEQQQERAAAKRVNDAKAEAARQLEALRAPSGAPATDGAPAPAEGAPTAEAPGPGGPPASHPSTTRRRRRRQNRAPVIVGLELEDDDPRAEAARAAAAGPAGGGSWSDKPTPPLDPVLDGPPPPPPPPPPAKAPSPPPESQEPAPDPAPPVSVPVEAPSPPADLDESGDVFVALATCDCGQELEAEWRFCPMCATPAKPCPTCERALEREWKACPYCTTVL